MKKILIIPDRNHLEECLEWSKRYHLGFEYNDFFLPAVLEDEVQTQRIINEYLKYGLPEYTTLHGAFYDVIPFSADLRVREIADLRIEQSISAAKRIGAKAVIFHTNYNPFLNAESYVKLWIKTNVEYWSGVLERHPDVNIYLENMFDTTPDILEELSERLCSYTNYGVCLDYAHASLSQTPPEIWAQRLSSFVKHIHINDNDLVCDLHQAWGDGKLNRESFYECYEKYMKDATVLIETTPMENKIRSLEVMEREGFFE